MRLIYQNKQRRIIKVREEINFSSFSSFHLLAITARAKSEKQISQDATDDEELTVIIDDKPFPKLESKEAILDSPASFNGGKLHNLSKTVYFLTFFKGRDHTITLETDEPHNTTTFESLEIYTLNLDKTLLLEVENQAEDGDRRPWLTLVLDNLPLQSVAPTISYSRRKRDSDDVKIIIDGKTQGNILKTIKHFLWRFVGSFLPLFSPIKTETETFTVNLPRGLHYIEFHADRTPILQKITFNFGTAPPIPEGIPTVDNPKWTKSFYDDTEVMLLARTIYGEAGGEAKEAKIGVGWAIRNRVEDNKQRWSRTYHEVILAEDQFDSLWNPDTADKVRNPPISDPLEKRAWEKSYLSAQDVLGDKVPDPTKGANHFYAITIPLPPWADEKRFTVQIGKTRFYKL